MTLIESAINLASIGLRVVPARGRAGIGGTYTRATTDADQIVEWWEGPYKGFNIAVVVDDRMVVDLDTRHDGPENWRKLIVGHHVPDTLTVLTPTGGRHLYFDLDGDTRIHGRENLLDPGVDIWSGSRITIAPPSIHPVVLKPYLFKDGEPDWSRGPDLIAMAPSWLIDRITAIESLPASARPGGRHQALLGFALRARINNGLDLDELFAALQLFADYQGFDDKPDSELWRIAKDTVTKYDFDPCQTNPALEQRRADREAISASFMRSWGRI